MKLQLLVGIALLATVAAAAAPFRDEFGRTIVLRGFNTAASSKHTADGMPWIRPENVAREARDVGSNFVRYLIQWAHIEPQPGVYNETYLDMTMERVGWYRDNGMHVMLDFHQDLWGANFTGNGAPAWATFTDGFAWTFVNPWSLTYLQPGVSRAWDNFWGTASSRGDELQGRFAQMAAHVAAKFKGKIYGIDIMNEPYGGFLTWPIFEPAKLKPFYQRVIDEVRKVDQDVLVFYEPQAFGCNQGIASSLGSLDRAKVAYAPHLYPLTMQADGLSYTGSNYLFVEATLKSWKYWRSKETSNLPMIIGEFGVYWARPGNLDYVDDVLDMADSLGAGWAYWSNDFADVDWLLTLKKRAADDISPNVTAGPGETPGLWSPYNADGSYNPLGLRLARPYARAVAGNNVVWWYEKSKRKMTVKFTYDGAIKAPTEIFIPADKFPNGYAIDGADAFQQSFDASKRVLSLTGGANGASYQISVYPK